MLDRQRRILAVSIPRAVARVDRAFWRQEREVLHARLTVCANSRPMPADAAGDYGRAIIQIYIVTRAKVEESCRATFKLPRRDLSARGRTGGFAREDANFLDTQQVAISRAEDRAVLDCRAEFASIFSREIRSTRACVGSGD